jgi:hypothetical protein
VELEAEQPVLGSGLRGGSGDVFAQDAVSGLPLRFSVMEPHVFVVLLAEAYE